jgi:truncated hemoglobin YjbI
MMSAEGPSRSEVEAVVRSQYARLRADPVVGALFARVEPGGEHEARITDFWWAGFGGTPAQPRSFEMLAKHRALALTEQAFEIWFLHLQAAVDEHLNREQAGRWMKRAQEIGVQLKRHTLGSERPAGLVPTIGGRT